MTTNCIISGEPTKARFKFKGQPTKIPMKKEEKKKLYSVIEKNIEFIREDFNIDFKNSVRDQFRDNASKDETFEEAYKVFMMGGDFHKDAIVAMIEALIAKHSLEQTFVEPIIRRLSKKYLSEYKNLF